MVRDIVQRTALMLTLIFTTGIVGAQGMGGMMGAEEGRPGLGPGMMQGSGMGMHGPMMRGDGWGMTPFCPMADGRGMMGLVDLDEEQQAQFRERRSLHRQENVQRMADMMDLRDEMHGLMRSDRPDPEAVRELHERMAELHGALLVDCVRLQNDLDEILTDDQRQHMRMRGGRMGGQ